MVAGSGGNGSGGGGGGYDAMPPPASGASTSSSRDTSFRISSALAVSIVKFLEMYLRDTGDEASAAGWTAARRREHRYRWWCARALPMVGQLERERQQRFVHGLLLGLALLSRLRVPAPPPPLVR